MNRFKEYYRLTKPGIIKGNLISVIAGFFIASSSRSFDFEILVFVCLGSILIMASGCVFNNYLDRKIDKLMNRTKNRSTVTGVIKKKNLFIFGFSLLILGVFGLYLFVNPLTAYVGLFGFISYVFVYGYAKRKSVHGTLVGSISGAIPPVAGYVSVVGKIDLGAFLVFLILVVWQMPHFYAISIFRKNDYEKAKIPVMSVVKGVKYTQFQILTYIFLFLFVVLLPTLFGITNMAFLLVMIIAGLYWVFVAIYKLSDNEIKWAKSIFGTSLLVLLLFCMASVLDAVLFL